MNELRIGLIGCGKMGLQHLKAIAAVPGARVVGVADPQADRDQLAELLPPDARIVSDARELLEDIRPDVVHIVTPPSTHASLARLAIQARCHVYVEKPFTPSLAEARKVLDLAAAHGVLVCPGHQYLFERPAVLARERLAAIGQLVHVESYFSFRMVRKTITPADQAKDILPHAVYPLVDQMRAGTGLDDAPFEIKGLDVKADGDVYALLRLGQCTGVLVVTLSGRPVEQYQHVVGSNGWLRADYVTGSVTTLLGPGSGPGILFTPYRRAFQTLTGATMGFSRLLLGRRTSYPGLQALVARFYDRIRSGGHAPVTPRSILDTVSICESVGQALDEAERESETRARARLEEENAHLPHVNASRGTVVVTGGTGLLGRRVAEELRHAGFGVRVLARRRPRLALRLAGVDYETADLARPLDPALLAGASIVAHCAAETAGGKDDHQRNSIAATQHVIDAAAAAGIRDVVHVSSLAVLKPGHAVGGGPLDEQTPVDADNLDRGPYVWGKAASEVLAQRLGADRNMRVKVVRPGPLVDYAAFYPPGRLGRELGPWFVAIGGKRTPLSVCDVATAARVIRSYAEDFDAAPAMLNLVEAPPPTRRELAERYRRDRPDLKFVWVPALLLRALSGPLKLVQRVGMGSAKPIDVYAAFSSERYRTDLAASVIERAGPTSVNAGSRRAPAVQPA